MHHSHESIVMNAQAPILQLHTSLDVAISLAGIGQRVVSKTWKETANQTKKERHAIVPLECVTAPELNDSPFRALVESALMSAAETVLRDWVNQDGDQCFEIPAEQLFRPNLVEVFLGRESWMPKEALDVAFTQSATWSRIVARPEFKSNKSYQRAANLFKDSILKLAGKNTSLKPELCDALLVKLDDRDLNTEFGAFVVKRLGQIKNRTAEEFDLSAL